MKRKPLCLAVFAALLCGFWSDMLLHMCTFDFSTSLDEFLSAEHELTEEVVVSQVTNISIFRAKILLLKPPKYVQRKRKVKGTDKIF